MKYDPIGTKFTPIGKHATECTVTDMLTTRNLAGEIVAIRYVATHIFMGQTVTNRDIAAATIARGIDGEVKS
jgi:hypothetical protein